jgi:hypothetical protein
MGSEYKRRQKEVTGQNAVRGYDVISAGATGIVATADHTAATDNYGMAQWTAPRAGLMDYVVAEVNPAVASGTLNISVAHGGAVVASGSLVSSLERVYSIELSNEVAIASGSVLQIAYAVPTAIGALGTAIYTNFSARVGLRYKER